MRESPIEFSRVELSIGDSVQIDDQILTVLDICDDEVTFRIETRDFGADPDLEFDILESGSRESNYALCHGEEGIRFPPR